jgi:acyl dehydratase
MTGKYYEDLEVGQIFDHPNGRTITETDNALKMRPAAAS